MWALLTSESSALRTLGIIGLVAFGFMLLIFVDAYRNPDKYKEPEEDSQSNDDYNNTKYTP